MKTDTDQRTSAQYPERNTVFEEDGAVRKSLVVGCGAYLPENIVTNDELAQRIDTSDAWIRKRTGIRQRHIAADGELTSDLAVAACRPALESAGVDPQEIDLIVLATSTPDNTFPATATRVQAALGIKRAAAFDVQAVCSGFVHALSIADNMVRLGQANTALVIGAEVFSRILDWEDRGTCVLFGDGAGALVLRSGMSDSGPGGRGVLSTHLFADGSHYDSLYVDGGVGTTGHSGFLRMAGQDVYRHAVHNMAEAVEIALEANGLNLPDIDLLVPHQANIRIIESIGRRLAVESEKVVVTVGAQANTSAATIPLALTDALAHDRINSGDLIALTALGGGFTWGSSLIRW